MPDGEGGVRLRRIGAGGLGQAASAEAQALLWHEGRLYVGTSGPVLSAPSGGMRILVWTPPGEAGGEGTWESLFETPSLPALVGGAPDPADAACGIHAFAVFEGESDPGPCIYAAGRTRRGPALLRSADGRAFEVLDRTTAGLAEPDFCHLAVHEGRLYAGPGPAAGPDAEICASSDPAGGAWSAAGPSAATGEARLAPAHGRLYAARTNPERGASLWRTGGDDWERVAGGGMGRHAESPAIASAAAFGGALHLGTGPAGGAGASAGAELLRVSEDGAWDLVVGRLRLSPEGLRVPLSGMGPGFDRDLAVGITALAEHDGLLWAGTLDMETAERMEAGVMPAGGFRLHVSANGTDWAQAAQAPEGHAAQVAACAMCPTPLGLAVATRDASAELAAALGEPVPEDAGFEVWLAELA